ncbi:hypothetical protein AAKU58_004427 [Oxalobacteraceae bacterium GrIS 1.18]
MSRNSGPIQQRQSEEGRAIFTRTADAKCRICLYGSSAVVVAFAEFERLGATMNTPEQCTAFTNMVAIMRKDSTGDNQIGVSDLEAVLLGVHKK